MTKTIFQPLNHYSIKIAMVALALIASSLSIHAEASKIKTQPLQSLQLAKAKQHRIWQLSI